MLNILVIEDDSNKLRRLQDVLSTGSLLNETEVRACGDLQSARRLLRETQADLLILDINVPKRAGEPPAKGSGIMFLGEVKHSRTLKKPQHIIGLTAYEEAFEAACGPFYDTLWWVIKYDPNSCDWEGRLTNQVRYLIDSGRTSARNGQAYDYDVAWMTALNSPEFKSVRNLNIQWSSKAMTGDSTEYLIGEIPNRVGKVRVVAASAYQMGMPAASVLAMKMIIHFRPRFIAITGIAAGIRGTSNFGDILVAEQSWDYNSGKLRQDSFGKDYFAPDPKSLNLHTALRERFAKLSSERKYVDDIRNDWPGPKPDTALEVRLGAVVSGSAVIQNARLVKQIAEQSRKLIGIEMETYGVFYAAENAPHPRPVPMALKSVCDFADDEKNDSYQAYAAFTSARFLQSFLQNDLHEVLHSI